MPTDYTPETGATAERILELARKRRQTCDAAYANQRARADEWLRFGAGQQWPEDIQSSREMEHRPCLTVDKTGQFVRQVVNDSRQNSPSIKVFPVGGGADRDVAEVFNGMIRDIEQRTDAEVAYDTAIESAARVGEGYFRLVSRYEDEMSFEQELAFQRVRNAASVQLDPAAQDPAGSDALYAFVDQWMPRDEMAEKYGDGVLVGLDRQTLGEYEPNWIQGDSILVSEYYTVEEGQKRTLALLKTGAQVILEETADPIPEEDIVAQKPVKVTRCIWRLITGNAILEKTVWPCRYIPIFRVVGEEFEIDGEVIYIGLIGRMMDSARMYNFWLTSATEKGALETKAPYVGAEGQFEGHEDQWRNANQVPYAYLEYKPVELNGSLVPAPQRTQASFNGRVDVEMSRIASDDMKASVGLYDASLGNRSNESSGKAILARQRESDTGTFHYVDNLARAIRHCGRVLVEVLPKYRNKQAVVRLLSEDGNEKMVTINEVKEVEGVEQVLNDITVGRYDVRVSVGPSYLTRRLEAADSMIQFVQAVPQAGQLVMDILAKNMDWPGAEDIAERLRKALPPQLQGGDEDEQVITPQQVQMMIAQASMQLQQQFEASVQNRETRVKEYDAETKRLTAIANAVPDEASLRPVIEKILMDILQQSDSVLKSSQPASAMVPPTGVPQ